MDPDRAQAMCVQHYCALRDLLCPHPDDSSDTYTGADFNARSFPHGETPLAFAATAAPMISSRC
jgi:hypothetical protein